MSHNNSKSNNNENYKVKFFSYDWTYEELEECTLIRVYGITKNHKNVYVKIEDFCPYCYVELPTIINREPFLWNENSANVVCNKLVSMCRTSYKPLLKNFTWKRKFYYCHKEKKEKKFIDKLFPYILFKFPSSRSLSFSYMLKREIDIQGIGKIKFRIFENDHIASPVIKLLALRKLPSAGWIEAIGKIPEDKESYFDLELICSWKNLTHVISNDIVIPKVMSIDAEANSSSISSMPNADKEEDVLFQISAIVSRNSIYSEDNKYKKYLLTLGDPDPIEGVIILKFKSEANLLLGLSKLILEENPNIILGYNIFGWDLDYFIRRAKKKLVFSDFLLNGCIKNKRSIVNDKDKWENKSF